MINIKNIKSDYLYLIWKNPQTRSRHHVGILKKSDKYEFYYNKDVKKCLEEGFDLLVSFPDINKKYTSDKMFLEFLSRIPGPTRIDIDEILKKYNLEKYDSFELLKRSGAKTSLDTLEFIDPILNLRSKNIVREFYVAGTSHCCKKENCEKIKIGDKIYLEKERDNKVDKNAIKMIINNFFVGYIPNYYSEIITKYMNKEKKYDCEVIDKIGVCNECLKVRLKLNID